MTNKTLAPAAGEYDTLYLKNELVHDKAFMLFDPNENLIMTFGYDTFEDLVDLYGLEFEDEFYTTTDKLNIGESTVDHLTDAIVTRIK